MQTTTGVDIATSSDTAPGFCTTSFQAEAYGILSRVLFLYHAFCFTNTPTSNRIKMFRDSESVMKRLKAILQYEKYYSSATIQFDWDVLQAIVRIIKTFDKRPNINHIRGHQDKKKKYKELSLEAQLKVDANKLAGSFEYFDDESPFIIL